MKRTITMALVSLLAGFGNAHAMEGTFDRSAEVDQYIEQLNNDTSQEALIATAKAIYISGIGDARLAQAIDERLRRDLPTFKGTNSTTAQYGAWLVKAMASTGSETAKTTIADVRAATTIHRIKAECDEQLLEIDWQRHKNEVMANRQNHNDGDDMRVSQLLNELLSDDYSLKQDAAYRMSWDKNLDARLMEAMSTQLQAFVAKGGVSKEKAEIVAMSHYAKMLGYSGNQQYGPVLIAVCESRADYLVKKTSSHRIETHEHLAQAT